MVESRCIGPSLSYFAHTFRMSSIHPGTYALTLHNRLQQQGKAHSLTWDEEASGPSHDTQWTMTAKVEGVVVGSGTASKKQAAKDLAAKRALEKMGFALE
ncbi:hypothetical protein FRC03_001517 [Tulasnella sp. 419]|nr:hypothetical protein FRC03_001517 [Tulasnella sp. 419]